MERKCSSPSYTLPYDSKHYSLKYDLWTLDPNVYVFNFKLIHQNLALPQQSIYVSRDGGRSTNQWRPIYENEAIDVYRFVAMKDVLFGISMNQKIYFYADRQLNIISAQRYEHNSKIILSHFNPAHIFKLLKAVLVPQETHVMVADSCRGYAEWVPYTPLPWTFPSLKLDIHTPIIEMRATRLDTP
ncbi:hypothetical protein RF11_15884 [Thelohanellus kitauei]|uniref:Uncharacterized protein n=1 Tax=Thelohanellus kitauei TaxID=669202 RepID=A0A0C2JLQ3_THEKT|nr:hypothetical protein RF11_15884 [Thelohanellus kitauei]